MINKFNNQSANEATVFLTANDRSNPIGDETRNQQLFESCSIMTQDLECNE